MPPKNVQDIFPLSPMQRLMLMHSIAHPDSSTLTNQVRYEIEGPLDVSAFRAAWGSLVRRHAALRTAVLWEGLDRPLNVVRADVVVPFDEVDASEGSATDQDRLVASLVERDSAGFDLGRAPLMRCTLVRRSPTRHAFVWSVHHLVVDRWSYGVLVRDLQALYEAGVAGRPAELPDAVPFRDYLAWLEHRPAGASERFWRHHLAGVRTPTRFVPTTGANRGGGRARSLRRIDPGRMARLEVRASAWRTTPATLVLASIGLVLAERNGSPDVVTGLTVSGRPAELHGVEEAVGSFVNNVPLRFELRRDRALSEWVREIQAVQVHRQPHEHESLDMIEEWSELPPGEALFDGLVVLNLLPSEHSEWADIRVRPVAATLDARYRWVLQLASSDAGLEFTLIHDDQAEGARPLLEALDAAVERLVSASPDARVGDVLELPEQGEGGGEAAVRPGAPTAWADDRSFLEQELLTAWQVVLDQPSLGLDDDFFACGGTSLQAARLFRRVEGITGRVLPLSLLLAAPTPRALLEALDAPPSDPAGPLVSILPGGGAQPIIAVPGIGGNVVGLYPLARELPATRPFFGLQSRGLDGRSRPLTTIEEIADDFAAASQDVGDRGVHLMGACWGAVVAFELAHRLEERGVDVVSLALVDPAPLLMTEGREPEGVRRQFLAARLRAYWDEFRRGDWAARGRIVREKARLAMRLVLARGRTATSESEMNAMRVKDANTAAVERYRPKPLRVPARIFFSTGAWMGPDDPRLRWVDLLSPRPEVVTTPGIDSGDAIQGHAAGFALELVRWLESVPPRDA
jgi:thioesterase domain-containing protein